MTTVNVSLTLVLEVNSLDYCQCIAQRTHWCYQRTFYLGKGVSHSQSGKRVSDSFENFLQRIWSNAENDMNEVMFMLWMKCFYLSTCRAPKVKL